MDNLASWERITKPSSRVAEAGAACWILGLEWFAGQAITQAAWTTPYSMAGDYISDLGATTCWPMTVHLGQAVNYHEYVCSPLHVVMNVSFVLLGLLTLAGVVLLRPTWPQRRLTAVGLVLLALFGAGKVVVGLAPEDVSLGLHEVGALGIPCGSAGILLLGLAGGAPRWRSVGSLCVGALGIVAYLLLLAAPQLGVGTLERLADYPPPLWLAVLGAYQAAAIRGHGEALGPG